MRTMWVLSDGRPGHYKQSMAVAEAIQLLESVEMKYVEVKVRGISKHLLRFMLNHKIGKTILQHCSPNIIKYFYKGVNFSTRPDIVVSSGKDTSLLNALTGLWFDATTVFVGNPKKLDNRLFTKILTVLDLGFDNQIVLDVAPVASCLDDIELFCSSYGLCLERPYQALLVGGDGSGYKYADEDIDALIKYINQTSDTIDWLVTTSPRTSKVLEAKMQAQMNAKVFIAYHQEPQQVMGAVLKLASVVYVTEESASMISEGIASCKPVVALSPREANPDTNYQNILKRFEKEKRLKRISLDELGNIYYELSEFSVITMDSVDEIVHKLREVIRKDV